MTAVNNIDNNIDVHKDVCYQVKHRLFMPYLGHLASIMSSHYKKTAILQNAHSIVAI